MTLARTPVATARAAIPSHSRLPPLRPRASCSKCTPSAAASVSAPEAMQRYDASPNNAPAAHRGDQALLSAMNHRLANEKASNR